MSKWNAERIVQLVRKAKNFSSFRYALLASLDNACDISEMLPDGLKKKFLENSSNFFTQSDAANREQEEMKKIRAVSHGIFHGIKTDFVSFNEFRFFAEFGLGLSTEGWTTALESNTYDFTTPHNAETEIENQLLVQIAASDSQAESLAELKQVSSSEKYCSYLRKQSIAALSALSSASFQGRKKESSLDSAGKPILLKKCKICHQGEGTPEIPFDKEDILSNSLIQGNYPRGNLYDEIIYRLSEKSGSDSMPRGKNLSEEERRELTNYFRSLKK